MTTVVPTEVSGAPKTFLFPNVMFIAATMRVVYIYISIYSTLLSSMRVVCRK
uniref:Uncharacterized protein n=1 Tax=viral metagenome TaxID=1070528 RepID=A0A6C0LZ21_9ZZZZ